MEELTKNWNNLTLSVREDTDFALPKVQQSEEYIIAAKFLTSRYLVMETVVRTFKQLWRSANGFKIRNMGDHIVLFVFDNNSNGKGLSKISLGVLISTLWSCRSSMSFQNLTNWFLTKLGSRFKYMTS